MFEDTVRVADRMRRLIVDQDWKLCGLDNVREGWHDLGPRKQAAMSFAREVAYVASRRAVSGWCLGV
jgi:hypothetical protein